MKFSCHVDDLDKRFELTDLLTKQMLTAEELVIVCVGTDRSAGDCLGPLVGTMLTQSAPRLTVYGTLEHPVHALNLGQTVAMLEHKHPGAFVLAIDACLGSSTAVGSITFRDEPLRPGLALKKDLPEVGHAQLTGIVNIGGFLEFFALQNARVFTTFSLAQAISEIVGRVHRRVEKLRLERTIA